MSNPAASVFHGVIKHRAIKPASPGEILTAPSSSECRLSKSQEDRLMNPLFRLAVVAVPFALALFVAASWTMATGAHGSIVKRPYRTTSFHSATGPYTI